MGYKRRADGEFLVDATFILIQGQGLTDEQLGAFLRRACMRWHHAATNPTRTQPYPIGSTSVWDGLSEQVINALFDSEPGSGKPECGWLERQLIEREAFRAQQLANGLKGGRPKGQNVRKKNPSHSHRIAKPLPGPVPATSSDAEPQGGGPVPDLGSQQAPTPVLSTTVPTPAPSIPVGNTTLKEKSSENRTTTSDQARGGAVSTKSEFTQATMPARKAQFEAHCKALNDEKKFLSDEQLEKFLAHFTAANDGGFKMLFEIIRTTKKVFSASGRMVQWRDRDKSWKAERGGPAKTGQLPTEPPESLDTKW